jgi:Ca-activated chloride channel family protein
MYLQRLTLLIVTATMVMACDSHSPPKQEVSVRPEAGISTTPIESQADTAAPIRKQRPETAQHTQGLSEMWFLSRSAAPGMGLPPASPARVDRENYRHFADNPVRQASVDPVSTFSIDVDTGSYANLRRILNEGRLPPRNAVRTEELINYFSYADPAPVSRSEPFRVRTEMGPTPWNRDTHLLRVGLKAWQPKAHELPPANLVFLVDVSGSMRQSAKLPLLKRALSLLASRLDSDDRVTVVSYAGASGLVLDTTPGDQKATIEAALMQLEAGGSTNGGAGIRLAYAKAREAFRPQGINRVILATDGDFNVGTVNHEALLDLVGEQRKSGIHLTTLGFGAGNYNDHLMEQLADHGDGNHAYIDNLLEAQKALVDEMGSTLHTVARDVKIQVEFNPATVAEYRLIGYENRKLRREDFNNDKVDAGDIGAGHSVTALYEITLNSSDARRIDPLRYGSPTPRRGNSDEVAFLRLRYKHPDEQHSRLIEQPLRVEDIKHRLFETTDDYRFSAAVAAFGQQLRGGTYLRDMDYAAILELARGARGPDAHGYRSDLLRLVSLAESIDRQMHKAKAPQDPTTEG